jgi:uncharacterized protein with von Willebrand factor type A (vWA) domain
VSGQLLHNLVLFGRVLRGLGLDVNPSRVHDVFHALQHIQIGRQPDFYFTLRSLLVHRHEDQPLFDQAFTLFWRIPTERWEITLPAPARPRRRPTVVPPSLPAPKEAPPSTADQDGSGRPPLIEATVTYSAAEVLRRKDFAEMTPEELAAVRQAIAQMMWRLGERRTRRRRAGRGAWLDLRRTVRSNLRHGGELLRRAYREPKRKPRPLVVVADVSGSMERYTRLLLHFVYSLTFGLRQPVESFVFGTRLTRITRQMAHKDVETALREVAQVVNDWAGGTRIGDCLKRFNFDWGRRVLGRGAVVLLISDGWDRGDPQLLSHEMARLKRSCHRLIWLNPLLGMPDYEPLTRGMQAALPYVHDFLPVHNLASLEDLAASLLRLESQGVERSWRRYA